MDDDAIAKELKEAIDNAPFTFSINCRSGLLKRCECWRCRQERGELVTSESRVLAKRQAAVADADFEARNADWMRRFNVTKNGEL